MEAAWEELERAGVPTGPARPTPRRAPDLEAVQRALATLARAPEAIAASEREALLAWLRAILRHWPSRAAALTGAAGESLRLWLEGQPLDPGRYLKLRRIAIENLAGWL